VCVCVTKGVCVEIEDETDLNRVQVRSRGQPIVNIAAKLNSYAGTTPMLLSVGQQRVLSMSGAPLGSRREAQPMSINAGAGQRGFSTRSDARSYEASSSSSAATSFDARRIRSSNVDTPLLSAVDNDHLP
jgi:hypothetical protein